VEAPDECPAPFYYGNIITEEGTFQGAQDSNGSGSGTGTNTGNNSGSGSGTNSGSGTSANNSSYNSNVVINGSSRTITAGSTISITGNLTSLKFTGSNMYYLSLQPAGQIEEEIHITNDTVATWSGNVSAPTTVTIRRTDVSGDDSEERVWFYIQLIGSDDGGGNGGTSSDDDQ
jgi:hypothetical protein